MPRLAIIGASRCAEGCPLRSSACRGARDGSRIAMSRPASGRRSSSGTSRFSVVLCAACSCPTPAPPSASARLHLGVQSAAHPLVESEEVLDPFAFGSDGRTTQRPEPVRRAVSQPDELPRRARRRRVADDQGRADIPRAPDVGTPDAATRIHRWTSRPKALESLIRRNGAIDRRRWESSLFLKGARRNPRRQPRH